MMLSVMYHSRRYLTIAQQDLTHSSCALVVSVGIVTRASMTDWVGTLR